MSDDFEDDDDESVAPPTPPPPKNPLDERNEDPLNVMAFGGISIFVVILVITVVCMVAESPKKTPAQIAPKPGSLEYVAPTYDYTEGPIGPVNWGDLADSIKCKTGDAQSPIHLLTARSIADATMYMAPAWLSPSGNLSLGAYKFQIDFNLPAGSINLNGKAYDLRRCNIHIPAEHVVDNVRRNVEVQFVHADQTGALVIVSFFYDVQQHQSGTLRNLLEFTKKNTRLNMNAMYMGVGFFQYQGSLATPPCTENVVWILMETPRQTTAEQVASIKRTFQKANARPVQPLGLRKVTRGTNFKAP